MTAPDLGTPPRQRRGTGATAVTPHELATAAAMEILAGGGNAVDASIAANAVLGVVLPTACGIGGDLFALVHRPGEAAPLALNASGRAGSGADAATARAAGHDRVPLTGPWGVTVPGCIDGWEALLAVCGTAPLADALQPAIRHAEAGFPVSDELSESLGRIQGLIGGAASSPPLYPGGRIPPPGTRLARPRLGETLRALAAGGRGAFYEGEVGRAVTAATEGRITAVDLAAVQAEWVEPLAAEVFGLTGWTIPPNSQGYLTLAAAWLLEQLGGGDMFDAAAVHGAVEAYRAVAWERDDLVADPGHAPLAPAALVDPDRLRPRLASIAPDRAGSWPAPRPAPSGTAFLCVVDAGGMGVSLIQSNFTGIGSGLSAGDTGVFLHNRGAGFTLESGHPNELAPGKRPLHTLSPTLWTRRGQLAMVLGTRGGHQQPQLLLQVLSHLRRLGTTPAEAQALPRWTMDAFGPGAVPEVRVESRMPAQVVAGLEARGHRVAVDGPWIGGWGPVSVITIDGDGVRTAAADPRVLSAAAAVS